MSCDIQIQKTEEPWFYWKQLAGYAYILICLFDFMVMPAIIQLNHQDTKEVITWILEETKDKAFVLALASEVRKEDWRPVTMHGGGLFHISFGAILTGAAVVRGFERREIVKNGHSRKPAE